MAEVAAESDELGDESEDGVEGDDEAGRRSRKARQMPTIAPTTRRMRRTMQILYLSALHSTIAAASRPARVI